eukprot:CAMPEP_0176224750 /NCGR_PEP_ID=MMETSP0121_2-20121125/21412_1 /TAXON_ID=160619 /ORGANISM="Kryptoperidinium foliaceum, Strain CCMP 1326" /LENGTH=169 /DNA_ID=CAMNT_0017564007 /DNA_START=39 /DNA_END=543 /DNA_ORIENTATION=-
MQFEARTLRTVEALHVIVLVLFGAYLPFCFMDPLVEEQAGISLEKPPAAPFAPAAGAVVIDGSEARAVGQAAAFVARPEAAAGAKGAADVAGAEAEGAELEAERQRCGGDESRVAALPFLIALLGGGVFSLEAFEALPMLMTAGAGGAGSEAGSPSACPARALRPPRAA